MTGATKAVPMAELTPIISELISAGTDVTISVTGNSMWPMLTDVRDSVVLTACDPDELKVGDIPLYRRDSGDYILHRILKKHADSYDISGDNQHITEYGVPKSAVVCKVKAFTRNGKYHSCTDKSYRLYTAVWLFIFPVRRYVLAVLRRLSKLFK